ncbi:DUF4013 domain-containing protein [Methanobacterium alcaliphilum]|nr:DUF4013 domain-containing protein [Methanobacterium alcaliphilum]
MIRIIKNTSQGIREMPPFEDLTNMFIDGIKFLVVNIAYSLPGLLFIYAALIISIFTSLSNMITSGHINNQTIAMYSAPYYTMDYMSLFSGPIPLLLLIIGIILVSLGYLIQVIAIPRMVYKDKVGAAFEIKSIYKKIQVLGWGKYLVCGIFFLIVVALTTILGLILPDLFKNYGINGYIISIIISGLLISSFEYCFQGRFMGLIYPGKIENEKKTMNDIRKPRFVKNSE